MATLSTDKRLKVACRVRPRMAKFGERYEVEIFRKVDESTLLICPVKDEDGAAGGAIKQQSFTFDYVFDSNDTQRDIYETAVQELVDSCLDGCNSTILAYGQTGSGKTFTVLGEVAAGSEAVVTPQSGLFLRTLQDLFQYKLRNSATMACQITLAVVEIYNDEVRDLLNGKNKLQVRDSGDDVVLTDLKCEEVNNAQDVYRHFLAAQSLRSVVSTGMNDASSRSHCVFIVDVTQTRDTEKVKSRLVLCDLAGSERVKKSKVEGQAMKEAQAINVSLTCLGTVVNALYREQKHIPFRDSKLTRLLRSSMVDSTARVLLITNLSPIVRSYEESIGSLRFANQVKGMKSSRDLGLQETESEQSYLASLRAFEELCAEVRVACATNETQLLRERPDLLESLRGMSGQAREDKLVKSMRAAATVQEAKRRTEDEELLKAIITEISTAATVASRDRAREVNGQLEQETFTNVELKKLDSDGVELAANRVKEVKNSTHMAIAERERVQLAVEQATSTRDLTLADLRQACAALQEQTGEVEEDFIASGTSPRTVAAAIAASAQRTSIARTVYESVVSLGAKAQEVAKHSAVLAKAYSAADIASVPLVAGEVRDVVEEIIDRSVGVPPRTVQGKRITAAVFRHSTVSERVLEEKLLAAYAGVPCPHSVLQSPHSQRGCSPVMSPQHGYKPPETTIDRLYRMAFVDSDKLGQYLLEYVKKGSLLVKHRRNGDPHFRRFWVAPDARQLYWVDPTAFNPTMKRCNISHVAHIMLGTSPEVLARKWDHPVWPDLYYCSFTLALKTGRPLHLVAMCMEEFEAWVGALSRCTQKQPRWFARPRGMEDRAPPGVEEENRIPFTKDEMEYLYKNHVPHFFAQFVAVDLKINALCPSKEFAAKFCRSSITTNSEGALHVTQGQLRAVYGLDIFRSSALWTVLFAKGILYDSSKERRNSLRGIPPPCPCPRGDSQGAEADTGLERNLLPLLEEALQEETTTA